ncbi:high affinity copper uptake protein 1-like [Babylonia areolata]|uniref:high affinity copper uptake protein 1-like n=1 Tax=Babylonia areolata TaxID=304850 RepID=UPI003FD2186F
MDMSDMNDSGTMPSMNMFFHTGFLEYVLFKGALTKTKGEFAAACLVVVVWAVLYELLKALRDEVSRRHVAQTIAPPTGVAPSSEKAVVSGSNIVKQICSRGHLLQTGLHAVQIFMSYCLMLVFMTYNVYLALCVIIGATLGYFIIGWRRPRENADKSEHCQ